jgi:malonyl-CoA/methylmalonyl-CoA synthetase
MRRYPFQPHHIIQGNTVFREYLNKPEATAKEFDKQGFFKTGDVCVFDTDKASYKILGRQALAHSQREMH